MSIPRGSYHIRTWEEETANYPKNPKNPMTEATSGDVSASILREAADIVGGARNATHGDKERSFEAIAGLWNAYLAARKAGGHITARDVAWMMTMLKAARSVQGKSVRDHYVDAAGYAAIAGECGDLV